MCCCGPDLSVFPWLCARFAEIQQQLADDLTAVLWMLTHDDVLQVRELATVAGEAELQELYMSAPGLLRSYGNQPSNACALLQVCCINLLHTQILHALYP